MKSERFRRASHTLKQTGSGVIGSGWSIMRCNAKVLGMPSQTLENWVRRLMKEHNI